MAHPSQLILGEYSFCPRNQGYTLLAAYSLLSGLSHSTTIIDDKDYEPEPGVPIVYDLIMKTAVALKYGQTGDRKADHELLCGSLPRGIYPDVYTGRRLPAFLLEALLSTLTQRTSHGNINPGAFCAAYARGRQIQFHTKQRVGPMSFADTLFPDSSSSYVD